ncbi:MAG: hypothetical protein ACLQUZ_06500 [Rhizomicrobium sp.]
MTDAPGTENPMEPDDDDRQRQRSNLVVLAVAILIVVIGWLVIHEVVRLTKLQDCEMAGHRDCEPIDNSGGQ